ncbi:hypothetical protein ERO13_A10G215016v2 [Gossypium hirsutum]|nr:hypothetical protein ERO13_A10G215016v2 [Gossypium hirsutum]
MVAFKAVYKTVKSYLFVIFSIICLCLACEPSFCRCQRRGTPVLDSDGNELRTGTSYFVVSSIWGAGGGGIAPGMPRGKPCPEVVAQRGSGDNGILVIFSNSDSNDGVVRLSSDINIEFIFLRPKFCLTTTTVWKVDDYDHSAGKWWVITDGVKGNSGANTLTSWFRIEKAGTLDYTHLNSDREMIRLALSTDHGWPFFFKKVETSAMEIQQVVHN